MLATKPLALALLPAAYLLAGCASGHTDAQISVLFRRMEAADTASDLDAIAACYADNARLIPPTGDPAIGRDAIRASYAALFSSASIHVTIHEEHTRIIGDRAICDGWTDVRITPKSGEPSRRRDDFIMTLTRSPSGTSEWQVESLAWQKRPR